MKLYADTSALRTKQVLGDLAALGWIALWVAVGRFVTSIISSLAGPVGTFRSAGQNLASTMHSGADAVRDLPLVGDKLVSPFDGAAGTGDGLVRSSDDLVRRIHDVATWTGILVAVTPILLGLLWWLGKRLAFVRTAAMTQRFIDADADLDLFALRAMANQPLERLDAVSHDPVGAWRNRDREVIRRLAAMELKDAGLHAPAVAADPDRATLAGRSGQHDAATMTQTEPQGTTSAREYEQWVRSQRTGDDDTPTGPIREY